MMMFNEIVKIISSVFLLIILLIIYDLYFGKSIDESCIFIPAVHKDRGIITEFCLKTVKGNGKVFIELPNVFLDKYQLSFVISKQAVCKIDERCNNYNYFFYTKEHFSGEGFSGTAGLATLILKNLYRLEKISNIAVTGFILPNGLILPVGGISEKLEASKSKNLILLAPSNFSREIVQIYTILDIISTLFNKTLKHEFKIPEKYTTVLREIALDICKDIEDPLIKDLIEREAFYTAASFCFIKKSEEKTTIPVSLDDLEKEILEFEDMIKQYRCRTYTCDELKFQILSRINLSKEATEINKKYWRFYTAKGWYKILKEFENVNRKNTCDIIEKDYEILKLLSNVNLLDHVSCFEKRELLSKFYYNFILNYNFDIETFLDRVEKYLFYLYKKNGFSITSYNYFVYGKDLIKLGNINDGLLYILYAVNYAV